MTANVPTGSDPEISYLSGVTSSGVVAATSFWTYAASSPVKWGSPAIGSAGGNVTYWFYGPSNWTPTEQAALLSGLGLWSAEANISFSAAASQGSASFVFYRGHDGSAYEDDNRSSVAVGGTSAGSFIGQAVISIDTSAPGFGPITNNFSTYGGYPYETLVHEEGHLIGLGHGGPYNGSVNTSTQQFSAYDTRLWTLMSYINPSDTSAKYYSSYSVTGTNWGGHYATTPMVLDILAAQELYGAATSGPLTVSQTFGFNTTITGSIARYFDFTVNTNPVITIWDSAAHNTLDVSGWSAPSSINLNQGTFSSTNSETNNIGIAVGTVIDKAVGGAGNDIFNANSAGDTLIGGAGLDTYAFSLSGWGVAHVIDTLGQIVFTGASGLAAIAGKFYEAVSGSDFIFTYWPTGSQLILQGVSSPQSWTFGYASAGAATASNWATVAFNALAGTPPDLTASGFSLNGLTASYQVNNVGTGTVPATTTGIYLSTDSTITTSDTLLATVASPTIASGGSDSESVSLKFPTNLPVGTYYVGAIANEDGQQPETSTANNASNAVPVILGNSGNSTLNDGGVAITMIGGTANNTFIVGNPGTVVVAHGGASFTPPAGWTVKGTADFNKDGATDVLVTSGMANQIWLLDNSGAVLSKVSEPAWGGAWQLLGLVDYNQDGNLDLLM